MKISGPARSAKTGALQEECATPHLSPQLWKGDSARYVAAAVSTPFVAARGCGQPMPKRCVYTLSSRAKLARFSLFRGHETDLSAKRAPAEAQARLPRPDGDACRPPDPEAASLEGPQAPQRVSGAAEEPPLPLARLRRCLPPRPLRVDALPDAALVRAVGRRGARRAASRPGGAAGGRERRRPQPDQAAVARDLARQARRRCAACCEGLRPRRAS